MDKFNLHDSLRIYLPGLLFCMLLYWLSFDTIKEIGTVALPAVFIGILLELIFRKAQRNSFDKLTGNEKINFDNSEKNIRDELKNIIYFQLKNKYPSYAEKVRLHDGYDQVKFIGVNYYSRSYSSENLSIFRAPKSYGILCYNSFLVCLLVAAIMSIKVIIVYMYGFDLLKDEYDFIIPLLLVSLGILFYYGSRIYYVLSLRMELSFWSQLSDSDLKVIVDLIDLYDYLMLKEEKSRGLISGNLPN